MKFKYDTMTAQIMRGYVFYYPNTLCETCINEMEDLVTSGEISAAYELLEEFRQGTTCVDCQALGAFKVAQ